MKPLSTYLAAAALVALPAVSQAVVISTWSSNEAPNGNYVVTITESGGDLNVNLTVNPWNAELFGFFLDLGNITLTAPTLTAANPVGQVSLFGTDTTSNDCGPGCNLQGLSLPTGTEWEYVVRLGTAGFNSIQTFSFTLGAAQDLSESMVAGVGIRAQQLCAGSATLPSANCGDSDKAFGVPPAPVPLPGTLALLGLGLIGASVLRRRA